MVGGPPPGVRSQTFRDSHKVGLLGTLTNSKKALASLYLLSNLISLMGSITT